MGPKFQSLEKENRPIIQKIYENVDIPELIQVNMGLIIDQPQADPTLADRICIERFSSYLKLLFTTARVLAMYQHRPNLSFRNVLLTPNSIDLENALKFWIIDAQKCFTEKLIKDEFVRLSPKIRKDGIIVVGTRIEKWLMENYNNEGLIYYHAIMVCHSYTLYSSTTFAIQAFQQQ